MRWPCGPAFFAPGHMCSPQPTPVLGQGSAPPSGSLAMSCTRPAAQAQVVQRARGAAQSASGLALTAAVQSLEEVRRRPCLQPSKWMP